MYVKTDIDGKTYYDYEEMGKAARFLVRMLNRIIDINDYPVKETLISNLKHRPLGIGT
jgi:ribonucleotide reductase alpha subunit